jgi:hypothetical protein
MIEKGLLLGLLVPLVFKPRATVAAASRREPPPLPGLPGPSVASVATVSDLDGTDGIPWPELPQMMSPDVAVEELLAELVDYHGAGAALRFSLVASYFRQFGRARLWPAIADKTLSQMLCARGCAREQRDLRASEGRRITFITLVPALAVDDDEIEAEPLRLAA